MAEKPKMLNVLCPQGNENKNDDKISRYTVQNGLDEKLKGQHMQSGMWSKWITSLLLVGVQVCATTLEIWLASFSENWEFYSWHSHTTRGYIPNICSSRPQDTCSVLFIAALFVIARIWNLCRSPSTEWVTKMWFIYKRGD